jgi:predicted metal-dependent hydrolase
MARSLKTQETPTVTIDGRTLPVTIKTARTSRRLSLRVNAMTDGLLVVMPPGLTTRDALRFVTEKTDWIRARLHAMPPRIPFEPGQSVPVLGASHVIAHDPTARRGVWTEAGTLWVSGQAEHVPRRVRDYLVRHARDSIVPRAHAHARTLGKRVTRVTVRDTRSRWGSCSSSGALSFSWRLVLAPEQVLDYVVVHEVAHMVELNHSDRFWNLVTELMPDNAGPRHWLKQHGTSLHRYG